MRSVSPVKLCNSESKARAASRGVRGNSGRTTYAVFTRDTFTRVLLRFKEKHNRAPQAGSTTADAAELVKLRDTVLDELKMDRQLVPDNFASHCTAEVSPVCAIVGGIVGQEIVKAVSGKDAPLNNFFFYDGVEGSGMVENFK